MLNECNDFLEAYYSKSSSDDELLVLEAGGGSISHFFLPKGSHLTSLDIDHGQLKKQVSCNHCVQGDIHTLPFEEDSFDILICFNVIEHLENPEKSLEEMYRCLKPGGLLVLGCPIRNSLKGIVTRMTPIGFHRWYYRVVVKKADRGDGHYDAFETPFKKVVAQKPILRWCQQKTLKIQFFRAYDGAKAYKIVGTSPLKSLFSLPYYLIANLGRYFTFGRWRAENSDLLLVAEKLQ